MPAAGYNERRDSERIPCSMEANYAPPGQGMRRGEARNIGESGILLKVSGNVKRDDLLEIEIPIGANDPPLRTRGRVVHTAGERTEPGFDSLAGINFVKLSEQQQQVIGKRIWQQILKDSTRFGGSDKN